MTKSVMVRLTNDEMWYVDQIKDGLELRSRAEVMRRFLWFFRILTQEDLPLWRVLELVVPILMHEKRIQVEEMLKAGRS